MKNGFIVGFVSKRCCSDNRKFLDKLSKQIEERTDRKCIVLNLTDILLTSVIKLLAKNLKMSNSEIINELGLDNIRNVVIELERLCFYKLKEQNLIIKIRRKIFELMKQNYIIFLNEINYLYERDFVISRNGLLIKVLTNNFNSELNTDYTVKVTGNDDEKINILTSTILIAC